MTTDNHPLQRPLGPVMLDLAGTGLTDAERERLLHPRVGGVILFTRNYESIDQLRELTDAIHRLREPRLPVAVDQEGGRVQRFRDGFTRLPAVRHLGRIYDGDRNRALRLARTSGWLMAAELRAAGVDLSFAPVLDLDYGISGVIGDRAFHHDSDAAAELAFHYMQGMREAGMAAVGKHFPGHGGVAADSHTALPVDQRAREVLFGQDLSPFEALIRHGLDGIMAAHVIYDRIDPQPAGFSDYWLQEVLREQLKFHGIVFSDDLHMAAAENAGSYGQRAEAALRAGCDMVLICNCPEGAEEVLRVLEHCPDSGDSQARRLLLHGAGTPGAAPARDRWAQAVEAVQEYTSESPA